MKTGYMFVLLAFLFASSAVAGEIRPYTDPLPLGEYVDDVDALLTRAYNYDGWRPKERIDENTYVAFISYKGYDITVRISHDNNALTLSLDSVYLTDCGQNCRNMGDSQVIQWLVNLRRTIAYEVTLAARDYLKAQAGF